MSQVLMKSLIARAVDSADYDHWQGGEPAHEDALCQSCGRLLLQIWDLNCEDPRFARNGEAVFQGIKRLPLLMCWRCSGSLAYVVRNQSIEMLECSGKYQGDNFPYRDYPQFFPRRALRPTHRDELPSQFHELLEELRNDHSEETDREFTDERQQLLYEILGRNITDSFYLWWHQVGGEPGLLQGLDEQPCPNPSCKGFSNDEPLKVLAAIKNDPPGGLPMLESLEQIEQDDGFFNSWVQLVYYVCDRCFAIRVVQDVG